MIKKCSKILFTVLCTFFISLTVTYAKEYTLDELAEAVKEVEADATYVYIIGEYAFTSQHVLTTQDTMLAARTIKTSLNSGATVNDPVYNEMSIVYLNGIVDDETWELSSFEFVKSVVGTATAQEKYEIKYIDYELIESEEYTVTFKNGDSVLATETLEAGTSVQMITDDLEDGLSKEGFKFIGWKNEATDVVVDENTAVTGDATYIVVWEAIPATVTAEIPDGEVGKTTEFTVSTVANGYAGTMVIGTSNFSNPDAIAKLEYYEVQNGQWYELTGGFGPATGFPLSDATSKFRVTWAKSGEYTFTMKVVDATDNTKVYAEVEETVNVAKGTAIVSTETELLLALGNNEYHTIELANNIEVSASVVVGRDVTIDGKGFSISRTGTPSYVSGGNNYVFKIYGVDSANVAIKDVKLTNSMAAIMVGDNANVTVTEVIVDGNVWGGIEVKDTATSTLTVESITHTEEAYLKPTVWVDNETVEAATITMNATELSVKNQIHFYVNEENAEGLLVADEDSLLEALSNNSVETIVLGKNIELASALTLNRNVVINGNGNEIKANNVDSSTLITISEHSNVTLDNVVVDANNELRAIKVTDANLTIKNSTVKNGNSSSYASGIFVTEEGNITIENSTITGNSAGESEPEEYYAEYSSDLWIGSEATGTINSGTIGNIFVNGNEYGNRGSLTVEDGAIEVVYLEYEDGSYATLNFNGGTISTLYLAASPGTGNAEANPAHGVYVSGV